jgi:hypothetical protein
MPCRFCGGSIFARQIAGAQASSVSLLNYYISNRIVGIGFRHVRFCRNELQP